MSIDDNSEEPKPAKRGRKRSKPAPPKVESAAEVEGPLTPVPGKKDYRHDPVGYCHNILGIKSLTPMQEKIFELVLTPPYRCLVACGHGVGKTYFSALFTCWFFDTYVPESVVLTTAPTHRDVVDLLWRYVRSIRAKAGLGGMVGNVVPEMRGESDMHYAKGFSCEKGESFSGRHQQYMAFMFDEATGINANFWETTSTMFHSRPGHHWIAFFNPLDVSTEAYRQWQRDDWHRVQMGCLDHPNVIAELQGLPEPYPGAVSLRQVDSWAKQWCDPVGELEREETDIEWPPPAYATTDYPSRLLRPGPRMQARALGQWPSGDIFGIWSRYAFQCLQRPIEWKPQIGILPEFGCDVAYSGEDDSAIHGHWGPNSFHHERHNGWSPRQTAARLKILCAEAAFSANKIRPHDSPQIEPEEILVKVDADGLGVNVIDNAGDFTFRPVCGSGRAMKYEQYYNKRVESWFICAQLAKDMQISISRVPLDVQDRLRDQLLAPTWAPDSRSGLCLMEPKDKTKERTGGKSPDDADAFILAYTPLGSMSTMAWQIAADSQDFPDADQIVKHWIPPTTVPPSRFDEQYPDETGDREEPPMRHWNFGA